MKLVSISGFFPVLAVFNKRQQAGLIQGGNTQLLRFLQLRPGFFTNHKVVGFGADTAAHLSAEILDKLFGCFPAVCWQCSGNNKCQPETSRSGSARNLPTLVIDRPDPSSAEFLQQAEISRFMKPIHNCCGNIRPNSFNGLQFFK